MSNKKLIKYRKALSADCKPSLMATYDNKENILADYEWLMSAAGRNGGGSAKTIRLLENK